MGEVIKYQAGRKFSWLGYLRPSHYLKIESIGIDFIWPWPWPGLDQAKFAEKKRKPCQGLAA